MDSPEQTNNPTPAVEPPVSTEPATKNTSDPAESDTEPAPEASTSPSHDGNEEGVIHPASDHFKIAPGAAPPPLKKPSIFTPKGVASWYAINHRAASVGLIAGVMALIIGSGVTYVALKYGKKPPAKDDFNPQGSDNKSLEKLSTDQLSTGKPGQTLTILADSKFKNDLTVGGNTALHKVTIDGTSELQGGATVQGFLNVAGNLTATGALNITGNGSFGGVLSANTLTAKSLVATGGLTLGGHILTGGTTPGASSGPASGGGSVLVSGNDTSGTVTITTGSAPFAGQMATINFRTAFASTPRVLLTAVGPTSARLQLYNTKSLTFFTIESLTKPEPGTTYTFDYFVAQ